MGKLRKTWEILDYHPEQGWSVGFWLLGTRTELEDITSLIFRKYGGYGVTFYWELDLEDMCFFDHYTRVFRFRHSTLFLHIQTFFGCA